MRAKLELQNIGKAFDRRWVLRNVTLSVGDGEFVSLLGPSGCGKSTILAVIAGFERPDEGSVSIDGQSVENWSPRRRNLGLVMQEYALFPRLSVRQNIEFGLKMRSLPRSERKERIAEFTQRLGLEDLSDRKIAGLNLSEKQRVALARVLVTRPSLLLLDEPMSNLDAKVRDRLRNELKLIQRELRQTVLYVTHDQTEALSMSDRIVVMREGNVEQGGAPKEIYESPGNRYVAEFIGEPPINTVGCTIKRQADGATVCYVAAAALSVGVIDYPEGQAILGIRPQDIHISREPGPASFPASVLDIENIGSERVLHLDARGDRLAAITSPDTAKVGDIVYAAFDLARAHFFNPITGKIIGGSMKKEIA